MIIGALDVGYDVVELLNNLTRMSADLIDVDSAGLLLADGAGVLHVLAASSENTRLLESFQVQRHQGPCLDCFATGTQVIVPDLAVERDRWPQFAAAADTAAVRSVHALPLRLRDNVLGALGLFSSQPGELGTDDLLLGQALADVASVSLVQDRAAADRELVISQLQTALSSRVVIEQAKGVLAQQGAIDMNDAFLALRRYSRDRNLRLSDAAQAVVDRSVGARDVLDGVRKT
jgi:GAF domain-containing protein